MSKKIIKTKNSNGFTLFELLVSISIIAILTAVAVVSFGGMNKKTRDTRRVSDIEKIRVALESYKQVNSSYPVAIGNTANLTGYLDKWPKDPKSNLVYRYGLGVSQTYYVCATMELVGSTTVDISNCSGMPATGYAGYYKAVQP